MVITKKLNTIMLSLFLTFSTYAHSNEGVEATKTISTQVTEEKNSLKLPKNKLELVKNEIKKRCDEAFPNNNVDKVNKETFFEIISS